MELLVDVCYADSPMRVFGEKFSCTNHKIDIKPVDYQEIINGNG